MMRQPRPVVAAISSASPARRGRRYPELGSASQQNESGCFVIFGPPACGRPYTVVAAELEEGAIIIADLDEEPATTLRLGLPLQLGYTAAHTKQGRELTLYHWTLARRP
jgi:hypothetical protein